MKRMFSLSAAILLVASAGYSQILDSYTLIQDKLDSGSRGNDVGTKTSGGSQLDGSEFADYSDADLSGVTSLRYINTWAGASQTNEVESPIVTCTAAHDNPDRALVGAIEQIVANPNAGPGDGTKCVLIGDDGGYNSLFFGDPASTDYFVQVDVYLYDKSSATGYERVMLGARVARDEDGLLSTDPLHLPNYDYSYNIHRDGGYAIVYDAVTKTVQAGIYPSTDTKTLDVKGSQAIATAGWHTFRIQCTQATIDFFLDGVSLANITDTSFAHGRAGVAYWESGLANADEDQGHFDNIQAGAVVGAVPSWEVFQ